MAGLQQFVFSFHQGDERSFCGARCLVIFIQGVSTVGTDMGAFLDFLGGCVCLCEQPGPFVVYVSAGVCHGDDRHFPVGMEAKDVGPGVVYCVCGRLHGQQSLGGCIQFFLPVVVFMGGKCQLLSGSGSVLLPVGHEAGQQSCQLGGELRGGLSFLFFPFIQLVQLLSVHV